MYLYLGTSNHMLITHLLHYLFPLIVSYLMENIILKFLVFLGYLEGRN